MTSGPASSNSPDPSQAAIRFDDASAAGGASCALCRQPIASAYYTVGEQVACESCKLSFEHSLGQSAGWRGVAKAIAFGSLWGLLGAAVWWGVRVFAQLEIGLIAIAIGYFVGKAVFTASGNRGGPRYQVLAVALTYFWICANYVPDIVTELMSPEETEAIAEGPAASGLAPAPDDLGVEAEVVEALEPDPASSGIAASESSAEEPTSGELGISLVALGIFIFGIALAAPFLEVSENLIGLLIISFGLWQAWSANQRANATVAGPFVVGSGGSATPGG